MDDNSRMVKVLGIHTLCHDSGAALISDDKLSAISEERLSRKKHDPSFPYKSISYVLESCGLKNVNEVDLVVFSHVERSSDKILHSLKKDLGYKGKMHYVRHHDAHAASAFFMSPFEDSAVLIVDGCGSWIDEAETGEKPHYLSSLTWKLREIQSFYRGFQNGFSLIRRTNYSPNHSIGIGILYSLGSMILGFDEMGAGKLMGLAAYGGRKKIFKHPFFHNYNGDIIAPGIKGLDPMMPENTHTYAERIFGTAPREESEALTNRHAELAHFIQTEAEDVMIELVNHTYDMTRCKNLCISGGVALNCLANTRIIEETPFENVFIQPAATDTGIPLGCALYGYHVVMDRPRKFIMQDAFLGSSYSGDEIENQLEECYGIEYEKPKNLLEKCAKLIAAGKVVGWFRGGSELGPRALGHRSILADPRNPGMKDHLNNSIKFRESFRPYAPSVLEEFVNEFFNLSSPSPFMLLSGKVPKNKRELIPAVVHVDGTSRIQTVSQNDDTAFYNLIKEFHKITGIPLILNTSLNVAGDPIAETPEDALKILLSTEMDFLVIEDFLVKKQ